MKRITLLIAFVAPSMMPVMAQTFAPKANIFGEGAISSKDFEFNAAFTPDNNTVYFTKALLPDWRRLSVVFSNFDGKKWSQPKLASFSGQFRDADPVISSDGSKLFFISDRPSPIKKDTTNYNFWYVEKTESGWSEPKHLGGEFYNMTPNPVYPAISKSGNIYYSSKGKLYVVRFLNNKYALPEPLSFSSTEHTDIDPAISPDETFLIFSSSTRKGLGGNDLWVSFNNSGKWSDPKNMGSTINSFDKEGQPSISNDGKQLYFATPRNKTNVTTKRVKRVTQKEFEEELNSVVNGLPNIWVVDISEIQLLNGNNK